MKMKIKEIHARQILDSRGNPTVEADVILDDTTRGRASVPSGASTGTHEALELRDKDTKKYLGKSVTKAVEHVTIEIQQALVGQEVEDQKAIDTLLIQLDGTPNKARLGANAILAVSLACAHAATNTMRMPLYAYIRTLTTTKSEVLLPLPLMNILNGGRHALFATDIQEFMIIPVGADTFSNALQMGAEIYHSLATVLENRGYSTTVGDEGGFAPDIKNGNAEALDLITEAVELTNYEIEKDIVLGLDVAASEFFGSTSYNLKKDSKTLNTFEMIDWMSELIRKYPIVSLEDFLEQDDWQGWQKATERLGQKVQLVGDDLFVTNKTFIQKGIDKKCANAVLIKPNQIGTLTETIEAVELAKSAGFNTIISHRSGETEDTTIGHLAVGLASGQIKTGSLSRGERTAKYNELLRIEEELGKKAQFAGKHVFEKFN